MSQHVLAGSCLCGSISYRITGDSDRFFHCHCQRCRKATGTGHASNILLKPEQVEWRGEDLLSKYKVPEAVRFSTCFCRQCGSLMPRIAADMSLAVVPAGTLDHEVDIKPQARIFQDSKTAWSCCDDVPAFDQYPV